MMGTALPTAGSLAHVMRRSTTFLGLFGVLAAAGTLTSCATFNRNDTAAEVNGHTLSNQQLDTLVNHETDPTTIRKRLSSWIQIASAAENPTTVHSMDELATLRDKVLADLIAKHGGAGQAQYEKAIDGTNYICLGAIPLAADVKADDVIAQLKGGTAFAELAKKYSTSTTLAASSGVIADQNGADCFDPATFESNFGGILKALADAKAKVGFPVAIDSGDGTGAMVILYMRPFAELSLQDQATIESSTIGAALKDLYAKAVITVNSNIGVWDPATGSVLAPEAG